MRGKRPAITIMIHRDGALESRTVRIPVWLLRLAGLTAGTGAVVVVLVAITYAPIARLAARVPGMQREIARLQAENDQVQQLAATLHEMETRYTQVRQMLGADVVPEPPRSESLPIARTVRAVAPNAPRRYEQGLSVPLHWPLDERGVITRGLIIGGRDAEGHAGLDIAVPTGTPIRAAGGGVVQRAGEDPELGYYILLTHPQGYESTYGHAARLFVATGDTVSAGEVVALSGSTGRSTAPHLHFEIRRAGRSIDPRTLVSEER